MKKITLIILFTIFYSSFVSAQNESKAWLELNTSISSGGLIRYGGVLDGGLGHQGQVGFLVGIGYVRTINEKFDIETGLDLSQNSFEISYIDAMGQYIIEENHNYIDLLTIPLNLRIKIKKNFVFTGGIQYDQEIKANNSDRIGDQTGLGINVKFGKDFKLGNKMILSLSPEIIVHDIVPFHPENHQQRLTELGLRIKYKVGL
jgi:hypothetical protein